MRVVRIFGFSGLKSLGDLEPFCIMQAASTVPDPHAAGYPLTAPSLSPDTK